MLPLCWPTATGKKTIFLRIGIPQRVDAVEDVLFYCPANHTEPAMFRSPSTQTHVVQHLSGVKLPSAQERYLYVQRVTAAVNKVHKLRGIAL